MYSFSHMYARPCDSIYERLPTCSEVKSILVSGSGKLKVEVVGRDGVQAVAFVNHSSVELRMDDKTVKLLVTNRDTCPFDIYLTEYM